MGDVTLLTVFPLSNGFVFIWECIEKRVVLYQKVSSRKIEDTTQQAHHIMYRGNLT